MIPSAPPAQPDDVELAKVGEIIFKLFDMNRGFMEVTTMIQELQERGIRVDKVQRYWIAQEDPHCTFIPAESNEEINIALVQSFPWQVSEEVTMSPERFFCMRSDTDDDSRRSVASIPPGPPLEYLFQAGTGGIQRLDKVFQAFESQNLPAEEDNAFWFVKDVHSTESSRSRSGMKEKLCWFRECETAHLKICTIVTSLLGAYLCLQVLVVSSSIVLFQLD